ncbi:MAG: hypothetical protein LC798_12105 [Chloroflexi bacterium]|nr:hypothetical protein [Chloroflexota bacterium]
MSTAAMRHLPTTGGGHHPNGPSTIATFSGYTLDLASPHPSAICVADIAHHLANVARFSGGPARLYSVAEHACLVHDLVVATHGRALAGGALFHDGHESFLGDIVTPLKPLLGPAYHALAARMDHAIAAALGLSVADFTHPSIKAADAWAFIIEARQVTPRDAWHCARFTDVPELPAEIQWTGRLRPERAEAAFLTRAAALSDLPELAASAMIALTALHERERHLSGRRRPLIELLRTRWGARR